jgi:hypothetical protein
LKPSTIFHPIRPLSNPHPFGEIGDPPIPISDEVQIALDPLQVFIDGPGRWIADKGFYVKPYPYL